MRTHHKMRQMLAAVIVAGALSATVAAPAYADDPVDPGTGTSAIVGYDSDGNPILTTDTDPDEPAGLPTDPAVPDQEPTTVVVPSIQVCDPGTSVSLTNTPNALKVDWADAVINSTSGSASYTVKAEVSTTFKETASISVSAEFKALIFSKVSATINGGIEHSKTTTYGSSVTVTVPAHKTMKADRGMWQEKFSFRTYKIDKYCRETRSSGTGQYPYRAAWHIYS